MDMRTIQLAVAIGAQAGQPILIESQPGDGKTSFFKNLARSLGVECEVVLGSIREPQDFCGLPHLTNEGDVRFAPPAWALRARDCAAKNPAGFLLVLDELKTVAPAVQKGMLRVVNERVVGDLQMPDNVMIVMATNPTEMSADGHDLTPPLANRIVHLPWRVDPKSWVEGTLSNWPDQSFPKLPASWRDGIPQALAMVASYINLRPSALRNFPKNEDQQAGAWASGRTWTMAAMMLAACDSVGASQDVKTLLISGAIGDGPAAEFLGWLKDLDLPDPEELLKDPKKLKMPERGDRQFAVLASVTAAVLSKNTKQRWERGWQVLSKAGETAPDIAAVSARSLARQQPAGAEVPKEAKVFIPLLKSAGLMG